MASWAPVGALHQHVGLDRADQAVRRLLVEDDHAVDAGQRGEEFRALGLGNDGPAGPLVGAHGSVGVDADDQQLARPSRVLQVADVPGVQQVEYTVGEDHPPAEPPLVARKARGLVQ